MSEKYQRPEGSLISYFSTKVKLHGGINLAQGLPGFPPPQELLSCLSEVALRPNVHQYAPGIGHFQLIDQLVAHYQKQCSLSADHILITQGATEAITLVYLYLKQQYKQLSVLAFDPAYESYNNFPNIFNDRFIAFSLHNNEIDFTLLENTIKKEQVHLIFINSPGNPLGKVFTKSEIDTLFDLSKKYRVNIILDAVYKELYFDKPPYLPVDVENPYLFYVNSFSKLFSITGWRVGYLICSKDHMKKIRSMHDYTDLCVSHPIQTAIVEYISKNGLMNNYVSELRDNIRRSFVYLSNELNKLGFHIPVIQGGYFIWAELPDKIADGFEFAVDLYDNQKVAIVPGIHFSSNGKRFVRFNFAHPMPVIEKAVQAISEHVKSYN